MPKLSAEPRSTAPSTEDDGGAMVVDVIASRQRTYEQRVLPLVAKWEQQAPGPSLRHLSQVVPDRASLGLRSGEAEAMTATAWGLLRFASDRALDEDDAGRAWADAVAALEHVHELDPYVGNVKGIGVALFQYLRMRCGADALKPDLRVRSALNHLGFDVPNNPHAVLVVARGAAAELGTTLLVLDQLLWWDRFAH